MFVTISNSNIIKMYILLYMIADCSGVDGPAVALQGTGETQVSHCGIVACCLFHGQRSGCRDPVAHSSCVLVITLHYK